MLVRYLRSSASATSTLKLEGYRFLLFQKVGLYLKPGGAPYRCNKDHNIERCFPNAFPRGLLLASKNNHLLAHIITHCTNDRYAELRIYILESISESCEYIALATLQFIARFDL